MLVAVVRFPKVPADRDGDFREWFAWSNDQLRNAAGLTGRRLLTGADRSYLALVEHESAATFAQMHASPAAKEVQRRLHQVLDDGPRAELYEVVEDTTVGDCCGGHDRIVAPSDAEAGAPTGSGCCQASERATVGGAPTSRPVSGAAGRRR